jgi:hypothetical protein
MEHASARCICRELGDRVHPSSKQHAATARIATVSPTRARGAVGLLSTLVLLAYGLAASGPAAAHLQVLRGKLLDLVQRSDLIVIGTAERVIPIGTSLVDTTIATAQVLAGTTIEKHLTFRGPTRFAPGERYVFFLQHTPTGLSGMQDAGTVFPCTPADDAVYRSTVQALSRALRSEVATRADTVRAALLPALAAGSPPLRYHAALELNALARAGHAPNAIEQARIEALRHDPATDPALQPLLSGLLRLAATPAPHDSAVP